MRIETIMPAIFGFSSFGNAVAAIKNFNDGNMLIASLDLLGMIGLIFGAIGYINIVNKKLDRLN